MYPFTNETGNMKVSEAMPLLNLIAADWKLKLRCNTETKTMFFIGDSFIVAKRILKNSARNN